jgi:transcription initiation factor TFIIH subunit 4
MLNSRQQCRSHTQSYAVGFLYQEFLQVQDFEAVKNYANEIGQLLYVNAKKRLLLVSEEGHQLVKAFVKRKIIKQ